MRIALYILIGIVILVIGFFAWFFMFFLKVPKLEIPENASEKQKIEIIDQWFSELQKARKFNGTVLLAKEGKPLLAKGYGFTNFKKTDQLTENSSLRLASVSKQFTAAGIMLLKEQGKLSFDDLVSKHVEGFPYDGVAIRHLLNQTSGVPDAYMGLADKNKENFDVLTNEIAVDLVIKANKKADNPPNSKYQYSNTNYILLARIIELISGLSFEDFMKQELFEPLGMNSTRVWNLKSADKTFENKADDFDNTAGKAEELKPSFIDGVAGDGAVFSSANDMLKWDRFWYGNELVSQETLAEAFKKPTLSNGKLSDYGFGWVITDKGMWHNGAWLGASTIITRNTEKKTCQVILDNSSNLSFDNVLKELEKVEF